VKPNTLAALNATKSSGVTMKPARLQEGAKHVRGYHPTGWWIARLMYKRREVSKSEAIAVGVVIQPGECTDRSPEFRYQF